MSFNITSVGSRYQEIHPYSAMNIDSVKINTSLIMMKEWEIYPLRPRDFPGPSGFAIGDGFSNTSLILVEHGHSVEQPASASQSCPSYRCCCCCRQQLAVIVEHAAIRTSFVVSLL